MASYIEDHAKLKHELPDEEQARRAPLLVRRALPEDAYAISSILDAWAISGAVLRREVEDVRQWIESFAVACDGTEEDAPIVACAALVVYSTKLAEIRSVASHPYLRRRGAAISVIEYLVEAADRLELERVFLLSKKPAFFGRAGFVAVEPEALPDSFLLDHVRAQGRTADGKSVMIRDSVYEIDHAPQGGGT